MMKLLLQYLPPVIQGLAKEKKEKEMSNFKVLFNLSLPLIWSNGSIVRTFSENFLQVLQVKISAPLFVIQVRLI